jgi:ribonuclease R
MARTPDRGQQRPQSNRPKAARSTSHRPRPQADAGLPSREQVLAFIEDAQGKVGKREIARAFGVTGGEKIALKRLLS